MTLIMRNKEEEELSEKIVLLYEEKKYSIPIALDYLEHNPYSEFKLEEILIGIIEDRITIMSTKG